MKKIFNAIIALTLVLCVAFTACSKKEEPQNTGSGDLSGRKEQTHVFESKVTDDFLVKEGVSEYRIVFPETKAGKFTNVATEEMVTFFKRATGITLSSGNDAGLTFDENAKYISIGDTTLLSGAGITVDKNALGSSGYIIKTVGKTIFIAGGVWGEMYGVYEFLEIYFNFLALTNDEVLIDESVRDKAFLELNIIDVPDIEHALHPYTGWGGAKTNYRLRLKTIGDVFVSNRGYVFHNLLKGVIPFEIYGVDVNKDLDVVGNDVTAVMKADIEKKKAEIIEKTGKTAEEVEKWFNHPEWYVYEKEKTDDPTGNNTKIERCQINMTIDVAKNDAWATYNEKFNHDWTDEENKASEDLLYEVMLYEYKLAYDNSASNVVCFSLEDHGIWSDDETSIANFNKFGTNTGEFLYGANRFTKAMKEYDPNVRVVIFAYGATKEVPKKQANETDNQRYGFSYVNLDENIDTLQCYTGMDRNYSITHEKNKSTLQMEEEWAGILKGSRFVWLYNMTYYSNRFMPTPVMNGLVDTYRYLFENDYRCVFEESDLTNKEGATDWAKLKAFLVSQLAWDCYQDMDSLLDKFFKGYYKAAAEPMRELFNMEQSWITTINENNGGLGGFGSELVAISEILMKPETWPDNTLQNFLEKIDDAYVAIEPYKTTDTLLYTTIEGRITQESLPFRFLRMEIYGSLYGDLKAEWSSSIYKDAKRLGMKNHSSYITIDKYFGS